MNIQVIRSSPLLSKGAEVLCVLARGTVSKTLSRNAQQCGLAGSPCHVWEEENIYWPDSALVASTWAPGSH